MAELNFTHDQRPIAIIGATGMLGRPVADALRSSGARVCVLSRDPHSARNVLGDAFDYAAADVRAPHTLVQALAGCRALHINLRATNLGELETVEAQGIAAAARAAVQAGLDRVGMISGAGMDRADPAIPFVRAKQDAEAALMGSGVAWTVFRATHFMESLPMFVREGRAELLGPQPNAYHYLAAADYGRMAARAYAEPSCANQALTILGPEPFTMRAALELFVSRVHPGMVVSETPLAVIEGLATQTGDPHLQHLAALFAAFQQLPEAGDRTVADARLGRAETTLAQWCDARAKAAR